MFSNEPEIHYNEELEKRPSFADPFPGNVDFPEIDSAEPALRRLCEEAVDSCNSKEPNSNRL